MTDAATTIGEGRGWRDRLGSRQNTSASDNASWLVAVGILAVVIPASDKVASNTVFFAAHGVSPFAWVVLLVVGLLVGWAVLFGILAFLRSRLSAAAFDTAASVLMLVVSWFFIGNALSRTVLAAAPTLGPVVGAVLAVAITLVARRFAMGTVLVVFAAIAAAVPLVGTLLAGPPTLPASSVSFDDNPDRPSILWVISDELSYPAAFDQAGNVRPELPNLAALASQGTTYSHAYSAANYTDYAVPSMLNGITDVAAQGTDRMQEVRSGIGIIPAMASAYPIVMTSPIYSFDCETSDCAAAGADDAGILRRYWGFAADTAAIAGKTALAPPFSNLFPSLDGKWRDFWSGGDEFGSTAEMDTYGSIIDGIDAVSSGDPTKPVFTLWHTIRTHAPWVVDGEGKEIYPYRTPIVDGAHMIGAEANQAYTTDELKRLERRLWSFSVQDFDRQLGQVIDYLKASGRYDSTMIVVTADHGATMTEGADRRVGDTLVQRWSEVAHVPLVVKAPGQSSPQLVAAPRSTGQIAASVLDTAGAIASPDLALSPDLTQDVAGGPVFTTVAGGVMTPWRYTGVAEVDPWLPEDLGPTGRYPFAIGIDQALLGAPVPGSWAPVPDATVQVLPGESAQEVLIVDRGTASCPEDTTVGLVSAGDTVVGSVMWEGPAGSTTDQTRGWAIVPRADSSAYRFWCPSS